MIGRLRTYSSETMPMSIEDRASRLRDPVAKLRYLRTAVHRRRSSNLWHLAVYVLVGLALVSPPAKPRGVPAHLATPAATPLPDPIFLVERKPAGELYSNGLFIRSGYETTAAPRNYRRFDRSSLRLIDWQTRPAGIVFHTTESLVPAIEADQAEALSRTREDVLRHVRRDRLYNFVIDRFGQVFRVVPEDQVALHAGHSVWADARFVFVDLNESFLGVAFEMKAGEEATAAQRHQGKLLTEMLRGAYKIADGNCVTHAQVSVNPDNQRIGYHTDWGGGFPFADTGLSVGYHARIAAVEVFGFDYDQHFLAATGGRPWQGLLAAEQQILIDAAAQGVLSARYRSTLKQQFQAFRRSKREIQ